MRMKFFEDFFKIDDHIIFTNVLTKKETLGKAKR